MAPIIGRELCELYVVPQIASFASDSYYKVRKAVAYNFINMCQAVSETCFKNKLIPVYQKYSINKLFRLSKDSLWIVRKAAVDILPNIAELCDDETKSTVLLDIFKNFTNDSQKFVKNAAIEILGKFIALLNREMLSDTIFDFYIKIIEEYYTNKEMGSSEPDV